MAKKKAVGTSVDLQTIIVEVAKIFRDIYGFVAPTPDLTIGYKNGYVTIRFGSEFATGMAAFSQRKVQCSLRIYHESVGTTKGKGETVEYDPWEIWNLSWDKWEEHNGITLLNIPLQLHIDYTHHNGGCNGYGRDYFLTRKPKVPKGENPYTLLSREFIDNNKKR